MKNRVSTIIILLTVQFLFAQQKIIVGKISGFKDNTPVRLVDSETMKHLDSTYIRNNYFVLKNPIANSVPNVLSLAILDSEPKFVRLYISNENVTLSGDARDFPYDLSIVGSKTQSEQMALDSKTKSLQKERDEIIKFLRSEPIDKNEAYQLKLRQNQAREKQIWKSIDSIKIDFINSNINSYVALKELSYLTSEYTTEQLRNLYSKLQSKYKTSKDGVALLNYINIGKTITEDDFYFDFEANDPNGQKHRLSEFKGKYILLDFTKEFCQPCEQAIKELKNIHQKYSDQITLISFTGEKSETYWKKGIVRNKIPWLSLWDGAGNHGKTLMKYDVQGFPKIFLINKEGKIVEIIDGYSDGILEPKVENLLKG